MVRLRLYAVMTKRDQVLFFYFWIQAPLAFSFFSFPSPSATFRSMPIWLWARNFQKGVVSKMKYDCQRSSLGFQVGARPCNLITCSDPQAETILLVALSIHTTNICSLAILICIFWRLSNIYMKVSPSCIDLMGLLACKRGLSVFLGLFAVFAVFFLHMGVWPLPVIWFACTGRGRVTCMHKSLAPTHARRFYESTYIGLCDTKTRCTVSESPIYSVSLWGWILGLCKT